MNPVQTFEVSKWRSFRGWVGWLLLCAAAASAGAAFHPGAWYEGLRKPAWNPPDAVFPPTWTVLYALMSVAAWRVWRLGGFRGARKPLALFVAQLTLNALWSPLFFGLHEIGWAAIEILLLETAILATIVAFAAKDRWAALLLAPYAAWVGFAAALNWEIWRLNG